MFFLDTPKFVKLQYVYHVNSRDILHILSSLNRLCALGLKGTAHYVYCEQDLARKKRELVAKWESVCGSGKI